MVTISIESISIYSNCLFIVSNKVLYFHTLQTMHLPLGLPSHLSSLFLAIRKASETSHKKHSALLTQQPSTCKTTIYVPCSAATKVHNIIDTAIQTQHGSWTPQLLSIQDRPHLPCQVSSNPQHDFSMHVNMHYTPMQHPSPHCLQQPFYAHK